MSIFTDRISRVLEAMSKDGLTQIIVTDPSSIYYLSGEQVSPMERMWALYFDNGGTVKLFANKLFVVSEAPEFPVCWHTDTDDCADLLMTVIKKNEALAVDKTMTAGRLLPLMERKAAASFTDGSRYVDFVRGSKDETERQKMREASRINDLAMEQFKKLIHEGVTELEVAGKLEQIYVELGSQGHSFSPIVSFGANAADPHHEPDNTVLKEGDCVLFDVGCKKDGYCADMTRTFFYKTVSDEHRKVYEIVKKANEAGEAAMSTDKRFCDADRAARDIIDEAGYGEYFTHRLGHSIGTQVHESGDVSQANTEFFNDGRCCSCEPGIYLKNDVGVRIEDLVLITAEGTEILNGYSKELEIIG